MVALLRVAWHSRQSVWSLQRQLAWFVMVLLLEAG